MSDTKKKVTRKRSVQKEVTLSKKNLSDDALLEVCLLLGIPEKQLIDKDDKLKIEAVKIKVSKTAMSVDKNYNIKEFKIK